MTAARLAALLTLCLLGLPIVAGAQDGPSLRDRSVQGLPQSGAYRSAYDNLPVPVKKARAIYPDFAREAQVRGDVILYVLVEADGRIKNLKVARGVVGLNEAAVDCVRQWVFTPALSNNKPVAAWIQVTVSFPADACPREVLEGGRTRVVAHVGRRFFAECLTFDAAGCALVPDRIGGSRVYCWALTYGLKIPKKPWVRGTIRVEVDTTGAAIAGHEVEGIGDCVQHPEECAFSVDEKSALGIAKRAGLKTGLRPWRAEFRWDISPRPCYVWVVANTLGEDGQRGEMATIDASTGEFLGMNGWIETQEGVATIPVDSARKAPNMSVRPVREVPRQILTAAQDLLVSRTGRDFSQRYLALDQRGCALVTENSESRWMLRYNLLVLRKPWVRGTVTVLLDSLGAPLGPDPVDGASDCIRHPEECTFSLTEADVRRIAKSAGLGAGIVPWTVGFQWDRSASVPCYVWTVSNTLTTDSTGFLGHYETMLISASTGRVLSAERH